MWDWIKKLWQPAKPDSNQKQVKQVDNNEVKIGKEAIDLILEFEGIDQPYKRPPGASGITLGYGFDLGFYNLAEFKDAWERHLSPANFKLLTTALGKSGQSAENIKGKFKAMAPITKFQAREVFDRCTIPKWTKAAAKTFPGMEILSPNQQGVLISIVFNRGTSLEGSRRAEMKNIATILKSNVSKEEKVKRITSQILAMQRVWPSDDGSTGHPGLRRRRRAEAALFDKG